MVSLTPFVLSLDVKTFRRLAPFRADLHRGPIALAGSPTDVEDVLLLLRSFVSLDFEAFEGEAFHVAFELEHGAVNQGEHRMSIELAHSPSDGWVRVSWSKGTRAGVFDADRSTWSHGYATSPLQRRFWGNLFLRADVLLVPFGVSAPCVVRHPLRFLDHVRGLRSPDAEVGAVRMVLWSRRVVGPNGEESGPSWSTDRVPSDVVAGLGQSATSCWWLEAVGACVGLRHPVVRHTRLVALPEKHAQEYSSFEFQARLVPGGAHEGDAALTDLQRSALAFGWALALVHDGLPLFVVEAPASLVNEDLVALVRERLDGRQWFFVVAGSVFAGRSGTMTLVVDHR